MAIIGPIDPVKAILIMNEQEVAMLSVAGIWKFLLASRANLFTRQYYLLSYVAFLLLKCLSTGEQNDQYDRGRGRPS